MLCLENFDKNAKIFSIVPEISDLINHISEEPRSVFNENIIIKRKGRSIHLFIKIGAVIIENQISNIIISFEDITQLVVAQREAAWSDVARRIAHEIKNPLTPIQLSAERLKSKFSKQIDDKDINNYNKYVDAIVRNSNDIHSIVNEFIQFARIPKPKLSSYNINQIIREVIFNQQNVFRKIQYSFDYERENQYVTCDKTQITQVLTNIAKNSAESIISRYGANKEVGEIKFVLKHISNDSLEVSIEDNGQGVEQDLIYKIAEPYMTTKTSGMGLGLSIVKKILEDHDSKLNLSNIKDGIKVSFNLKIGNENNE